MEDVPVDERALLGYEETVLLPPSYEEDVPVDEMVLLSYVKEAVLLPPSYEEAVLLPSMP
jgi:hypothetical protein